MAVLKKELNQISKIITNKDKVAYLDYPVHSNIGDILIMKGTERFFREHRINVTCRYSRLDYSPKIEFPSNIILTFHGGGNFGDLYPEYQKFREYCIEKYRKNKIVILPQTIHYKDPEALERASNILSMHPDLHIFVRDKRSFKIAKKYFSDYVYLAPDMAHALWPIHIPPIQTAKCLYIFRTDKERCYEKEIQVNNGGRIADWPRILTAWDKLLVSTVITFHLINKAGPISPALKLWDRLSENLVNKVIRVFSNYSYIVSSRLHGHILACAMNLPNTLLDNFYGKNSSYYNAWTYRVPLSTFQTRSGEYITNGLSPIQEILERNQSTIPDKLLTS